MPSFTMHWPLNTCVTSSGRFSGLRFDVRPRGKDLFCKNHEAASTSWPRRANPPNLQSRCSLRVGATGRSPDRPAASCGSRSKPPRRRPARPMLFCTEGPCPQATTQASRKCQPRTRYGPPAEPGVYHNEIIRSFPKGLSCFPVAGDNKIPLFFGILFPKSLKGHFWSNSDFHSYWEVSGSFEWRPFNPFPAKHVPNFLADSKGFCPLSMAIWN